MPLDTRFDKRHPIEVNAKFCVHESMSGSVKLNIPVTCVAGKLDDISASGCALESPYLIPPHTLLRIDIDSAPFSQELKRDHPQPITVTGTVKSCIMKAVGRYRLGVHFAEITKEDLEFINEFIKAKEQRKTPRWNVS
jgi:hypothetical protein